MIHFVDNFSTLFLTSLRSGPLTDFFYFMTTVGGVAGVMTILGGLFLFSIWSKKYISTVVIASGTVLAWAIQFSLKLTFLRSRPSDLMALVVEDGYSFPSGHALVSFVFFGLLTNEIIKNKYARKYSRLIVAGATLLIFLIGLSRVYLGVHFATDVLGGWLIGLMVWLLVVWLFKR